VAERLKERFAKRVIKALPALQAEEVVEVLKYKKQKPTEEKAISVFKNLFLRPPRSEEIKQVMKRYGHGDG